MRILATYDKITPESAEEGDYSESGWLLPYGVELPMPDGLYGEEAAAWIADNVEPVWSWSLDEDGFDLDEATEEAARVLRDEGATESSPAGYGVDGSTVDSYYQADWYMNHRTGEETRNTYHLEGFTPDQLRAVYRRVQR